MILPDAPLVCFVRWWHVWSTLLSSLLSLLSESPMIILFAAGLCFKKKRSSVLFSRSSSIAVVSITNELSKYKSYHLIFKISIKKDKIPTMNFDENVWIISTKDYIYFPKGKYICLAGWNIRMTVCGEAGRRNWSWNPRRQRKREEWSLVLGFTTNLFGEMQIQIRYFFGFEKYF